ncbi:thioredoxin domain-containing protein [Patescibacteria group bacterium]|nr:thioredoxin domain-containing protein [Patescibacteria group bacterium]
MVSLAILAAGGFTIPEKGLSAQVGGGDPVVAEPGSGPVPVVTDQDYIRGNPDAPITIVEYSDFECPFCGRFHPTVKQVLAEYGDQVRWVYRHFPLDQIHSKARIEAAAVELANELGGNDKFWDYLDRLFEITPSNDRFDLSLLSQIAEDVGLPRKPFEEMVNENDRRGGKFAGHIESDYQDGIASGGTGTPYSVVIAPNGKTFSISGAQPYSALKSIIELALKEK